MSFHGSIALSHGSLRMSTSSRDLCSRSRPGSGPTRLKRLPERSRIKAVSPSSSEMSKLSRAEARGADRGHPRYMPEGNYYPLQDPPRPVLALGRYPHPHSPPPDGHVPPCALTPLSWSEGRCEGRYAACSIRIENTLRGEALHAITVYIAAKRTLYL